jgi:uncharacterized protein
MNPPLAVLDTNIWLDWLLFDDPSTRPLAIAHTVQSIDIIASSSTLAEFAEVIARSRFDYLAHRRGTALQRVAQVARTISTPISSAALRCSDPLDQQFLDLAIATGAQWLLTKDKALLKLARRARAQHQLTICTGTDWAKQVNAAPSHRVGSVG